MVWYNIIASAHTRGARTFCSRKTNTGTKISLYGNYTGTIRELLHHKQKYSKIILFTTLLNDFWFIFWCSAPRPLPWISRLQWPGKKLALSTQEMHCFRVNVSTYVLIQVIYTGSLCTKICVIIMSDSRYQHGKQRLDPHLHLYGKRRLEPCTSPRNKFWSFYYTGTIRPTSTAGHVKKTVFGLIAWWAAVCGVACSCSGEKDFAIIFDHLVVLVVTGMILVIIKPIAMVYNHVRLSLLQGRSG